MDIKYFVRIIIDFTNEINRSNIYSEDGEIIARDPKEQVVFEILTFKEIKYLALCDLQKCLEKLGKIGELIFSEIRYEVLVKQMNQKYGHPILDQPNKLNSRQISSIFEYLIVLKYELATDLRRYLDQKDKRKMNKLRILI